MLSVFRIKQVLNEASKASQVLSFAPHPAFSWKETHSAYQQNARVA
jgi:hypothetical protein